MLNNNYYSSPDHRPPKSHRLYPQQIANTSYRNDSTQNLPTYTRPPPSSTLQPRPSFTPSTLLLKQSSTFSSQQLQNGYKPPSYQQSKTNDFQRYIPSPKTHNTSFNHNHNSTSKFNTNLNNNGFNQNLFLNQSDNPSNLFDSKDVNQKIDLLAKAVRSNQKKISQLQRNYLNTSTISKLSQYQQLHDYKQSLNKIRIQKQQLLTKFTKQIQSQKQQLKNYISSSQIDKLINHKIKLISQQNKQFPQLSSLNQLYNIEHIDHIYRQLQNHKNQINQKLKTYLDNFNHSINKIQQQLYNIQINSTNSSQYKSSGIKCTGTAILLRFIQCFKVRKNHSNNYSGTKGGQMKITLMDNTYYIDNQGYLLDKDQCYLVDYRGVHIRLQQKHIKILKQQNVLI